MASITKLLKSGALALVLSVAPVTASWADQISDFLASFAHSANTGLGYPKMMSEVIRVDAVTATHRDFILSMTFVSHAKEDVETIADQVSATLFDSLVKPVACDAKFRSMVQGHNVLVKGYVYDKDQQIVAQSQLSPDTGC